MDIVEKALDLAAEGSKLLLTLSTALVAFCAATVNVKQGESTLFMPTTVGEKWAISASWLSLLASVAFGVWTQLGITDVLAKATPEHPPSAWSRKITLPYRSQIATFVVGVVGLTLYGLLKVAG